MLCCCHVSSILQFHLYSACFLIGCLLVFPRWSTTQPRCFSKNHICVCGGGQNDILWKVIISLPSRLNPNYFKPWENWLAALIWRGESDVGFSYTVCSPQALLMPKKATWWWKLSHSISIRGPVVQLWPIWTTTSTARLSAVWSWALLSELCLAVVAASYTRWEVLLNEAEETAGWSLWMEIYCSAEQTELPSGGTFTVTFFLGYLKPHVWLNLNQTQMENEGNEGRRESKTPSLSPSSSISLAVCLHITDSGHFSLTDTASANQTARQCAFTAMLSFRLLPIYTPASLYFLQRTYSISRRWHLCLQVPAITPSSTFQIN